MAAIVGVVDLTHSAERLLSQRLAGQPILNWTIRRLTESQRIDRVVVLVSHTNSRKFASLLPTDITIFPTDAPDALAGLADVARSLKAGSIVRVPQNCPFVDPVLVDQLVADADKHRGCDYVSYRANDGRPAILSQVGLFAEWCRAESICSADVVCSDPQHREHGTSYLFANPQRYNIRLISTPAEVDCSWLRLSVANGEDCELLEEIVDALGPDHLDWQEIVHLIEAHPSMKSQMVSVGYPQRHWFV